MKIGVTLFSTLREFSPTGERHVDLDLPQGSVLQDLMGYLRIPEAVERVMLIDGRHATPETPLQEGQRITLFPPVAGG